MRLRCKASAVPSLENCMGGRNVVYAYSRAMYNRPK